MSDKNILIVDDDEVNLYLIENFLMAEGFKSRVLKESTKVIDTVKEMKPDAIIMDIMMPEINGDILAEELKKDPATSKIPIILVTADIMKEQEGLAADHFIRRPIMGDDLIGALKRLLSIK